MNEDNIYKKKYGQNFLINEDLCKNIVNSLKVKDDNSLILEIGPGDGAISKYLYDKYKDNFYCVEIDEFYVQKLKNKYKNIQVLQGNFLKLDISKYKYIIGNIPYYITSDILLKLALDYKNLNQIVLMIQEDAYKRIIVASKKEEKTPISIILKTFFASSLLYKVSKNNFYPVPNVSNVVFELIPNKIDIDCKDYYNFLLKCFSSKRKTLINNLIKFYKKEKIEELLEKFNISKLGRPEDLLNNELLNIYLELKK